MLCAIVSKKCHVWCCCHVTYVYVYVVCWLAFVAVYSFCLCGVYVVARDLTAYVSLHRCVVTSYNMCMWCSMCDQRFRNTTCTHAEVAHTTVAQYNHWYWLAAILSRRLFSRRPLEIFNNGPLHFLWPMFRGLSEEEASEVCVKHVPDVKQWSATSRFGCRCSVLRSCFVHVARLVNIFSSSSSNN